jgi:hypothetical protein
MLQEGAGLFFSDFDDFASLVLAALRADSMRQFWLVAVRTLGHPGRAQMIVRPPRRGSSF